MSGTVISGLASSSGGLTAASEGGASVYQKEVRGLLQKREVIGFVAAKVVVAAVGPAKQHVLHREHDPEQEAQATHHDVGDAKEIILAPDPRRRGQNDSFRASEGADWEPVGDADPDSRAGCEAAVFREDPVQLAEGGQRSNAHPDHEIRVGLDR
eukprot:CAMPEP_0174305314 /NCGR_PEP_ID=MMETSP0809-20121228/61333_1 /TAXON_ID=73025 ORGANISM="Eutreptiella gymnastica-like, Strain CCMP1594" /NCGR_SAMPLE_ID=MMETSP0809 /ASSEMBLY_ACC=CAM_ASM_000658 /LENGTH=154 /DNA_ID=CAMNT_0015411763 /DNA_START=1890 /DNA_END=2355 /DNA_ORIENTATION=-